MENLIQEDTPSEAQPTRFEHLSIDWKMLPLKYISSYNDDKLEEGTDPDLMLDYVEIGSVHFEEGIQHIQRLQFGKAPSRARRRVREGDTIISTVRTYLKAIAYIPEEYNHVVVSTGFVVIRPRPDISPRFLGYALQEDGFVNKIVANSVGVSYPAINPTSLVRLSVPIRGLQQADRVRNTQERSILPGIVEMRNTKFREGFLPNGG